MYRPDPAELALKEDAKRLNDDLIRRLRGKSLICEIEGFEPSLHEELTRLENRLWEHDYWRDRQHLMKYRCVHAVWLTLEGVFRYENGALWEHTSLGNLTQDLRRKLGEVFEEMVDLYRLEGNGIELPTDGQRFLSRILMHGGIPLSAVPDYFRLLLSSTEDSFPSANALVRGWRASPQSLGGYHQPVKRFLLNGGLVAEDFVDRSLDFLRLSAGSEVLQDLRANAMRAGLPDHFAQAFAELLPEYRRRPVPRVSSTTTRPRIVLDAYAAAGPKLQFPAHTTSSSSRWRVSSSNFLTDVTVSRYDQLVDVPPARSWQVEWWETPDATAQRVAFAGTGDADMMLFDESTGVCIEPAQRIREPRVYVLHPRGTELRGANTTGQQPLRRFLEDLPELGGRWGDYMVSAIEIDGLTELRAGTGSPRALLKDAGTLSIDSTHRVQGVSSNSMDVYSEVPRVIGLVGDTIRGELTVNGRPIPLTSAAVAEHGDDFLKALVAPSGVLVVSLVIRQVLGRDLRASFVVVPDLRLAWTFPNERASLSSPHVTPAILRITAGNHAVSEMEVPLGDRAKAFLTIADPLLQGALLTIAVPVLLWSFPHFDRDSDPSQRIERFGIHDLLDGRVTNIAISGTAEGETCRLRLVTPSSEVISERVVPQTRSLDGKQKADLRPFSDAIRHASAPVLILELAHHHGVQQVALFLTELNASEMTLEARVEDSIVHLEARWNEALPLPGRVIRMWNRTRPRFGAVDYRVPSDARGASQWESTLEDMPPGQWVAVIGVHDEWQSLPKAPPRRPTPNSATCEVGTAEDVRTWVRTLPPGGAAELERVRLGIAPLDTGLETVVGQLPEAVRALRHKLNHWTFSDFDDTRQLRRFIVARFVESEDTLSNLLDQARVASPAQAACLSVVLAPPLSRQAKYEKSPLPSFLPSASTWRSAMVLAAARLGKGRSSDEFTRIITEEAGGESAAQLWPRYADPAGFSEFHRLHAYRERLPDLRRQLSTNSGGPLSKVAETLALIDWMIAYRAGEASVLAWLQKYRHLLTRVDEIARTDVVQRISSAKGGLGPFDHTWFTVALFAAAAHAAFDSSLAEDGRLALMEAATFAPALVETFLARAYLLRWSSSASASPSPIANA